MLSDLVSATPDVIVRNGREFTRDGVLFAARPEPDAIELRLGPEIADAAMRTPQTGPSQRGDDWIRLQARDWTEASDRVAAWYRVAWRLAKNRR